MHYQVLPFLSFTQLNYICFVGDGIVVKGQAYGIRSIRVDGNDALAVYNVIRTAREMAITEQRPILVEVRRLKFTGKNNWHAKKKKKGKL